MMTRTSCCGCFSLKTGTMIVGVMNIIYTVFSFIMVLIVTIFGVDRNFNSVTNRDADDAVKSLIISMMLYLGFVFALSVTLLHGTKARKLNMIFPYLCLEFTNILVSVAAAIGFFSYLIISMSITFAIALTLVSIILLILALRIYLWLVVYYFYYELLHETFGCKVNPATGKILREPFEHDV